MRSAELEKHIRTLARQHKVRIIWTTKRSDPDHNRAHLEDRWIRISHIRTKIHYCLALHEIGHFGSKTRSHPQLFQEAAAWAWAKEHALLWTKPMQVALVKGLRSYLNAAHVDQTSNRPNLLKYPPKDHPFWTFLQREPDVRKMLKEVNPAWLNPNEIAVPWATVLSHPDRPRCSNCAYWNHVAQLETNDTREKLIYGNCIHRHRPLGVEMTPAGALCGVSYERKVLR